MNEPNYIVEVVEEDFLVAQMELNNDSIHNTVLVENQDYPFTVEVNNLNAPGADGKSAYISAIDGGYIGTEEQFNTDLADVSTKESTSNKKTDIEANKDSSTFYATIKAIYDWCVGKFQLKLVSGINIKTLNEQSILGPGDITITASATTDNTTITGTGTIADPFKISDEYQRRINAGI